MGHAFQKIAVIGRHDDARVAEPMAALVAHLTKVGVDVFAAETNELDIDVRRTAESKLTENADLIIAIGGDGTMLYAARVAGDSETPVLGVNRGRLGFLADITPDEMLESVDHVLQGNFTRDSRLKLSANLHRPGEVSVESIALNDVVLQRRETGRMVDFETRIGDRYVNTHAGDGLVVATPTGSTAYALSCGGPIIQPHLDALVVVPVCPHTLTDRPLVVPADLSIDVRVLERDETKAEVTVDGLSMGEILPQHTLTISSARRRLTLIHPPGYDYYSILRSKLLWGRDTRVRVSSDTD